MHVFHSSVLSFLLVAVESLDIADQGDLIHCSLEMIWRTVLLLIVITLLQISAGFSIRHYNPERYLEISTGFKRKWSFVIKFLGVFTVILIAFVIQDFVRNLGVQ